MGLGVFVGIGVSVITIYSNITVGDGYRELFLLIPFIGLNSNLKTMIKITIRIMDRVRKKKRLFRFVFFMRFCLFGYLNYLTGFKPIDISTACCLPGFLIPAGG